VSAGRSLLTSDARAIATRLRVTATVGALLGLVVGGVGGRLGMLALRLTSDDSVRGVTSDDGFEIGQVTLGGTIGLLAVGMFAGLIGAFAHRAVAPFLIGPSWLRSLTCALGAGAVVGSMLVHADGVDFTLLAPTWLAIAIFVALPALFGAAIGPALRAGDDPEAWINRGRWRRRVPALLLLMPVLTIAAACVASAMFAARALDRRAATRRLLRHGAVVNLARAGWLFVSLLGLWVLVVDIGDVAKAA
jgi:hypothetical protein